MVIQEPDLGPQRGGVTGREGKGTQKKKTPPLSDTNSILLQVLEAFHERRKRKKKSQLNPVTRVTMSAHNAGRVKDGPCRGLNRA